ncbi:MAG TPA: IPT/TIG domain-containing protein [Bryobacteraceae bacterium]|nr:IPT/TIG domain-containing protein [Bryobacteraceae bacterium]
MRQIRNGPARDAVGRYSMTNRRNAFLNRRSTLAVLGGGAVAGWAAQQNLRAASTCLTLAAPQTEGPYWVEENLNRSDIRSDPSTGTVYPGVLLNLAIALQEVSTCTPLAGARVDIWHCSASGTYSDEAVQNTTGKKFLRGYQVSDDNGNVNFTTIYPGWYSGRTVHIHVRVRTYSGSTVLGEFTAQFFFDDSITDQVFAQSPYNTRGTRDTRNANDMVLTGTSGGAVLYLSLTQTATGYAAAVSIGVNLQTAAVTKPVISAGGVVSAASFQAGIAPGAWTSIFGQNLAATTLSLMAADLVNSTMPTSLGGVSVSIDGKPAFVDYVSPTLINVQAPADGNTGSVAVTVTNASGTSDAATATLAAMQPAFFASNGYVAAVSSSGEVISPSTPAKVGDQISLYGNGFGATSPSVAPGLVLETAAALTNSVVITIGGVQVVTSFAGLSSTGLYQLNVIVPNLADGDHAVLAMIGGLQTQSGVLLRVKN